MHTVNSNESKLIEELYLTLQITLLVILLNFSFPFLMKSDFSEMKGFSIAFGVYVASKTYFYFKSMFFDEQNNTKPNIVLSVLDGLFIGCFVFIQEKNGVRLHDLFYIYLIVQAIRYPSFKSNLLFSFVATFIHMGVDFFINANDYLTIELLMGITLYFCVSLIVGFALRQLNSLKEERHYYYSEVQKKNTELETLVSIDYLTKLNNHQSFYTYFEQLKYQSFNMKQPITLALVDIDNFKRVNDTYGHLVGDFILKELARILKQNTRRTDFAARYGGEEFVVVFPNTPLECGLTLIERLRESVENHTFATADLSLQVTVSIGIDTRILKSLSESEYDFINDVDLLLYQAKSSGKNQVQYPSEKCTYS